MSLSITEPHRTRKITYDQRMRLSREVWAVSFKYVNSQWWCYIMLLGGRTERTVNRILNG